jgi:TonB-dependent receptor
MAKFDSELWTLPVSGNIGARVVRTDVTSRGLRGSYDVVDSGGTVTLVPIAGTFDGITMENSFTNVLPSANATFKLPSNRLLRFSVYRALARPNIEEMGAGRNFTIEPGATSIEDAISGITGGNPQLEPLESWNTDLALEWYPNPDTALAFTVYYKLLQAGIVPAYANVQPETFVIEGQTYTLPVSLAKNSDDTNNLYGFEVTAQHSFTSLPAPFDGLGFGFNYNFAESDFEYEDPSAVDAANPLRNFTSPAGINGLSRHSGSVNAFYEKHGLSLRVNYKYRSQYLKTSGLAANRFVEDAGFLDMSVGYNVTEHVQVKLQGLNLLGQPQVMYRPVDQSIAESSYYGASYFLGARVRF